MSYETDLEDLIKRVECTTKIMRAIFWIALAVALALAYPLLDKYLFEPVGDLLYFALR